jgi:murein DD-endopeptidase MepM/ murein hydrolase activator NlpD
MGYIRFYEVKDTNKKSLGKLIIPGKPDSTITSDFGPRDVHNTGAKTPHGAIDDAVVNGTRTGFHTHGKVLRVVDVNGEGKDKGTDRTTLYQNGFGQFLEIEATKPDGGATGYKYIIGHIEKSLVKKNDKILPGQAIALSGNAGHSTGPHLHIEIWKADETATDGWKRIVSPNEKEMDELIKAGLAVK